MKKFASIAMIMGLLGCAPFPAPAAESDEDVYEMLNLFGDVFERVSENYVEETTSEELIENAINGMLTALDPHSGYLNTEDFQEVKVQTKGEFGGLGIEVTMDNGLVKVVSPIDDTPAYEAGIMAGDYISHINDEPVIGLTLAEAVDKMRGPVGSDILVTILREGESEPLDITITRAVITIRSVRHRTEEDVGYVRITSFSEKTYSGLEKAVKEIKSELGDKLKGFVLDLRNNPGGLLDQAIAVSDAFLEQGEIVSTRGRTPDTIRRYNSRPGDLIDGMPIAILINGGSASASEIVSGALQDHKRAVILGTKSFGKGSVQTVIPISQHGAMRLTTSRYYTPSGRSIQAEGIEPDIIVEPSKVVPLKARRQHKESDLRGSLKNTDSLLEKANKLHKAPEKDKDEEEEKAAKEDHQFATCAGSNTRD